jgi:hypothetical protein
VTERAPDGWTESPESSPGLWEYLDLRRTEVDRAMHKLRTQMIFLFAFLVVALIAATVHGVSEDKRMDAERWDRCQERVTAVGTYNLALPAGIQPFPAPQCGPDPRTD